MRFMAAALHLINSGPFIRHVWLLVPNRVRQQHSNQSNVVTFLQMLFRAWCEIVIMQVIWKQLSTESAPVIKVSLGRTSCKLIDNDLQALEIKVVSHPDVSPCTVERDHDVTEQATLSEQLIHFRAQHHIFKAPRHHQSGHLGEHRFSNQGFQYIHEISCTIVPWDHYAWGIVVDHEGQIVNQGASMARGAMVHCRIAHAAMCREQNPRQHSDPGCRIHDGLAM
jgi:hypothetical protein